MTRRVCSCIGCTAHPGSCPAITISGRCASCQREADTARGTASQRGYTSRGHRAFRNAVLQRDPICTVCQLAVSTVADHHPDSRRDLLAAGLDPNHPTRGRGLCARCHSRETTLHQPGGWLLRD